MSQWESTACMCGWVKHISTAAACHANDLQCQVIELDHNAEWLRCNVNSSSKSNTNSVTLDIQTHTYKGSEFFLMSSLKQTNTEPRWEPILSRNKQFRHLQLHYQFVINGDPLQRSIVNLSLIIINQPQSVGWWLCQGMYKWHSLWLLQWTWSCNIFILKKVARKVKNPCNSCSLFSTLLVCDPPLMTVTASNAPKHHLWKPAAILIVIITGKTVYCHQTALVWRFYFKFAHCRSAFASTQCTWDPLSYLICARECASHSEHTFSEALVIVIL